jgi:CubicO group peptidase (beta-lactamase class C family)
VILPEFAGVIHQGHKSTTLEMLACHVSRITESLYSIEDGQLWKYLKENDGHGSEGRRAVTLCYLRHRTKLHWTIIGFIIEHLTGSSWERVMKTELFNPLEMYHTGFVQPDAIRNSTSSNPTQPWPHTCSDGEHPKTITRTDPTSTTIITFYPSGLSSTGGI